MEKRNKVLKVMAIVLIIAITATINVAATTGARSDLLFVPTELSTLMKLPSWAVNQFGEELGLKFYEEPKRSATRLETVIFLSSLSKASVSTNYDFEKFADGKDVQKLPVHMKDIIAALVQKNILRGDLQEDGTLRLNLNQGVKRSEVCAILKRLFDSDLLDFGKQIKEAVRFSDVSNNHWALEDINWASSRGIFEGNEFGEFGVDSNITVLEAIKLGWNIQKDKIQLGYAIGITFKATVRYLSRNIQPLEVLYETQEVITRINISSNAAELKATSSNSSIATASIKKQTDGKFELVLTAKKKGQCNITLSTGNVYTEVTIMLKVTKLYIPSSNGGGNNNVSQPKPPNKDDIVPPVPEEPIEPPSQPNPPSGGGNPPVPNEPIEPPSQPNPPSGGGNPPVPDEPIGPPEQPSTNAGKLPASDESIGVPLQPAP